MRHVQIFSVLSATLALTGCGVEWGLNARHFGYEKPGVLSWEEAKTAEAKRPPMPKASPEAAPEYNDAPTASGGQKLEASKLRYNSLKPAG
jgi:hypothetical protein